ncbi:ATP-binding protein [Neptuniibacter caesariensis]|uniref:histidine kinase n=1 Tax=Neptuniibacter caesariensis TaxID=207954 RepID=A0A7U8C4F3_NEPCE|nr:ATP-binding protein [Neptuniibacter caesariensis]EAR61350.1 sensor histidine kinase with a response regulator receiver domain [Oceanospirillum sp. MED92] [Neptuniibacter caesariensis]
MSASQRIFKERRHYNKWVANQTLEDYALRFTAVGGRHMSISKVGMTALGATSFLALEGLAAAVTLSYGFVNTLWAMLAVCFVLFITGFPIAYHCAKNGLDIDLLTRGAGFGYLGSTITSLIYASFTFIFFAIEAAILASALKALMGIPLFIGYIICAVAVIPIVTHGITAISKFQLGTQFVWLLLQISALVVVIGYESEKLVGWSEYTVPELPQSAGFDLALFGAAVSVLIALIAQIGEQADYLRFMPPKTRKNRKSWWFWVVLSGPGWVWVGLIKMLLGSFLAYLAITELIPFEDATDPTYMYQRVFQDLTQSPALSLILAAVMVILCQMKINVTNAYAGSIAWSNFFSRLTHSHPGRVVWLVFNVAIALLLMELGIYQALEAILGTFAILALAWLGSLSADLLINRPLGFSPKQIEFKRAHLYDINPVGIGSMLISTIVGFTAFLGVFGEAAQHLCHFVTLLSCLICVPLIAILTKGRYYLARDAVDLSSYVGGEYDFGLIHPVSKSTIKCGICENRFEHQDMTFCPAYQQPICSLCCSLDVRCLDACKPKAGLAHSVLRNLYRYLPRRFVRGLYSRLGRFVVLVISANSLLAGLLMLIFNQIGASSATESALLEKALITLFIVLFIASGVIAWLFLLAHESRLTAQKESNHQSAKLTREIDAHEQTDRELQEAKEQAERANEAKSRYLTGISHELRTPLQSILGYAQLLSEKEEVASDQKRGLKIIHRSGQYLTDLIEGLLDISKIEAGRLDLFRNQVNLPELIDQMVEMFRVQADKKSLVLNFTLDGRLPDYVMTDEKRLRQILINLLSNAIKYTDKGKVDFHIRYRNQVAEFVVRDTGPGIEKENLDRVFQPFERVRNSSNAHRPGTGLGLTIVKLLTEIMGGDLQVKSEIGTGSEFRVSLLLPWLDQSQAEDTSKSQILGYEGFQKTLLLADDDPILRGLLSDLLVPLGFNVIEAHDGENALELLENNHPDLFLLDISMPGMSGLELAQELRRCEVKSPIIMLSANVEDDSHKSVYRKHYDDYLVKPVNNHQLLERIGQWLDIKWIYRGEPIKRDDQLRSFDPVSAVHEENRTLPIDHELLIELKAYAEMGYQKGVTKSLIKIRDEQLLSDEVMGVLQRLSEGFQLEKLAQHIEEGRV